MMHGKALWKLGITEIAKASRGFASGSHKGGLPWTPSFKDQHADAHLGYGLWTQNSILHKKGLRSAKVLG